VGEAGSRAEPATGGRYYLKQYVDRMSSEPACRSGESTIAVETFMNNAGSIFLATAPLENRDHGYNQAGLHKQQQRLSSPCITEG
jgi:hypothetical protein